MAGIRARVKEITAPRHRRTWPIAALVEELNPVLRGWGNFFRWGNSTRKFVQIDSYVRERLALFDSKKRGKSGRRWGEVHTYAWYNTRGSACTSSLERSSLARPRERRREHRRRAG